MFLLQTSYLVYRLAAVLAYPFALAIRAFNANPGGFIAFRADQHDIADRHRSFKLDYARLHCAALRLGLFLVFFSNVNACHNDSAFFGQDFDHFAAPTFVLCAAADHFNGIIFSDLYSHGSRS
jgi:hypothetical protein